MKHDFNEHPLKEISVGFGPMFGNGRIFLSIKSHLFGVSSNSGHLASHFINAKVQSNLKEGLKPWYKALKLRHDSLALVYKLHCSNDMITSGNLLRTSPGR